MILGSCKIKFKYIIVIINILLRTQKYMISNLRKCTFKKLIYK